MEKIVETERLLVREYEEKDIPSIQAYAGQDLVVQYQNWGPNSLEDTHRFFRETQESKAQIPRLTYAFCIELKENSSQIGGCEAEIDSADRQLATIGYILHPRYWNQGYATEVTKQLIQYARKELSVSYFQATCDERNLASRRVLEKSGFTLAGVIKGDFIQKGYLRTTLLFKQ